MNILSRKSLLLIHLSKLVCIGVKIDSGGCSPAAPTARLITFEVKRETQHINIKVLSNQFNLIKILGGHANLEFPYAVGMFCYNRGAAEWLLL